MDAMSLPANRYCSIARALTVVGQKWNLLLLREAFLGHTKYAEFQRIGIPHATLGQRLEDLVDSGLLERQAYREDRERTRAAYVLTPAGRDVLPILTALSEWGDRHLPLEAGPGIVYVADDEHAVHLEFRDGKGERVPPEDVSVIRGPAYYAALSESATSAPAAS